MLKPPGTKRNGGKRQEHADICLNRFNKSKQNRGKPLKSSGNARTQYKIIENQRNRLGAPQVAPQASLGTARSNRKSESGASMCLT